ncbi:MAG: type VI secretion system baseplate subunit TssK [Pelomonas sp.]|nr:type VI secretion system baseplate subunit TssK [Roseateles sp.]
MSAVLSPRSPVPEPLSDAVQWWEGMLLAPQHLQQADLYWAQQLRYRLAQVTPCYWGVSDLAVDELALAQGRVHIERLECVMPDGTPVVFPGSYKDVALELDVAAQATEAGTGLRIMLLMPRRLAGQGGSPLARHDVVEGELIIDENSGATAVAVDRLRPRLRLWAGDGIPPGYQVCPLFEVQRHAEQQRFEFGRYHPPLLRLGAADVLGAQGLPHRLRALNRELWLKLRELGGDRRDDAAEDATPLGGLASRQLDMARRLATVLPRLGLLTARPEAAPLAVYDLLAEVAGVMASFGANPIVPMFDVYRHDDCEPQFSRALEYIERKLGFIDTAHEWLPFERTGPGVFRRAIEALPPHGLIVELRSATAAAVTDAERREFTHWLTNACIASEPAHAAALQARMRLKVRALTPEECARQRLRSAAALYLIEPDTLGEQALLMPDQPLLIEGLGDKGVPAAILLVVPRATAVAALPRGRHA